MHTFGTVIKVVLAWGALKLSGLGCGSWYVGLWER